MDAGAPPVDIDVAPPADIDDAPPDDVAPPADIDGVPPAGAVRAPPDDVDVAPPADDDGAPPADVVECAAPPEPLTAPPELITGPPPPLGVIPAPPLSAPAAFPSRESPPPQATGSVKTRAKTAKRDETSAIGVLRSMTEEYSCGSTWKLSAALIPIIPVAGRIPGLEIVFATGSYTGPRTPRGARQSRAPGIRRTGAPGRTSRRRRRGVRRRNGHRPCRNRSRIRPAA